MIRKTGSMLILGRMFSACDAATTEETLTTTRSSSLARTALQTRGGSVTFNGDVWADNWFAFSLGETLLLEDSVSITTERSLKAERFSFQADYPLVLALVVNGFKENDTGLESIGSPKQQMGDGGVIAQITDTSTGKVIAVTSDEGRTKVIHKAPLEVSCVQEASPVAGVEPCGFDATDESEARKTAAFDDSGWEAATIFSAEAVGRRAPGRLRH